MLGSFADRPLRKDSMLSFLGAVVLIVNSGYYLSIIRDSYIPLIMLIAYTALLLVFVKRKKQTDYIRMDKLCVVLLLLGIAVSAIINFSQQNLLSGGRVAATMVCAYFIMNLLDPGELISKYTKIIRFIVVFSTLMYFVTSSTTLSFLPVSSTAAKRFYNLLIWTQGLTASRLTGVFWEPGVFATHIIFSALFEIYFERDKTSAIHIMIYLVGIFLTGSAAGILIMGLVLLGYYMKKYDLGRKPVVNVLFVALVIVLLYTYDNIFAWMSELSPTLFGKLTETTSSTTYTRLNSPVINLQLFFEKPVFGWGFTDAATQYSRFMSHKLVAQTSTSTQILSCIGILGAVYSLMCVFPLFSRKNQWNTAFIDKIIIVASLMLIVNKEPHIYIAVTWWFLFFLVSNRKGDGKNG